MNTANGQSMKTKSDPRYFSIICAFAGLSTITKFFAIYIIIPHPVNLKYYFENTVQPDYIKLNKLLQTLLSLYYNNTKSKNIKTCQITDAYANM